MCSSDLTIGMVLNNSAGSTAGGISIGSATENNQVGIMAKDNSNLVTTGDISVNGNKNIGIYGEESQITTRGNLLVGDSSRSEDKSISSIGVVLSGGSYTGSGNLSAGNYSIGVFGKGMAPGSKIGRASCRERV